MRREHVTDCWWRRAGHVTGVRRRQFVGCGGGSARRYPDALGKTRAP